MGNRWTTLLSVIPKIVSIALPLGISIVARANLRVIPACESNLMQIPSVILPTQRTRNDGWKVGIQPNSPGAATLARDFNVTMYLSSTDRARIEVLENGFEVYLPPYIMRDPIAFERSMTLLNEKLRLARQLDEIGLDFRFILKHPLNEIPKKLALRPSEESETGEGRDWLTSQRNFKKVKLFAKKLQEKSVLGYSYRDTAYLEITNPKIEALRHEFTHASNWVDCFEDPKPETCGHQIYFESLSGPLFKLPKAYQEYFFSDETEACLAEGVPNIAANFAKYQIPFLEALVDQLATFPYKVDVGLQAGNLAFKLQKGNRLVRIIVPGVEALDAELNRTNLLAISPNQIEKVRAVLLHRLRTLRAFLSPIEN